MFLVFNQQPFYMKKQNLIYLFVLLFSISFFSCKDDDKTSDTEAPSSSQPTALEKVDVEAPAAMKESSDMQAQQCVAYIEMFNSIKDVSSLFEIPSNATKVSDLSGLKSTETEAYSWSMDGQTIMYVFEELDNKYTWTIYLSVDQYNIENAKAYYAEEMKDGSSGLLRAYSVLDDEQTYAEWSWKTFTNKVTFVYSTTVVDDFNMTLNVFNDNSGDLTYVVDSEVYFSYEWDITGHGTYTLYDGTTGSW